MILGKRWLWVLGFSLAHAGCYAKGEPYVAPETSACTPLEAGDVEIEYLARVEMGEAIVVLRPSEAWTYDDFRLFMTDGEPRLVERQVKSVVRARDGGSTWIRFDFHGEIAEVAFPVSEPASLTTGSGTYSVEPLPSPELDTFSFECLADRESPNSPPPDGGA